MPGFETPPIEFACSRCGYKLKTSFSELKPIMVFTCPHCSEQITLVNEGLQVLTEDEVLDMLKGPGKPN